MSSFRIPRSALRVTFAALALAPLARAADAAPAPVAPRSDIRVPSSDVPDYSAAFEKLFALGLPDSRGGVFVMAQGLMDSRSVPPVCDFYAWRMPASGSTPEMILVNGVVPFAGGKESQTGSEPPSFAEYLFDTPAFYAVHMPMPAELTFRDAELKREIVRAYERLARWGQMQEKLGAAERNPATATRLASSLILAAHGWRAGHTVEANRLAHAAMTATATPEAVSRAAVSALADACWAAALREWARTPERAPTRLATELETITKRYAQGWYWEMGAQHLLTRYRSGEAPADPKIDGHTFTSEQLRFARELVALRDIPEACDWLAPAKPGERPAPIIDFLRKQGIDALPLLAALSEDDTPTACISWSEGRSHTPAWSGANYKDDPKTRVRYRELAFLNWTMRPLTRGDIAKRLARMVESLGFDHMNDSSFCDDLLAAHATLNREGRIGLLIEKATEPMTGGNRPDLAWMTLLKATENDADCANVEAALISETANPGLSSGLLPRYLRKRGEAASAFIEKFSTAARTELASLDKAHFPADPTHFPCAGLIDTDNPPLNRSDALAAFDRRIANLRKLVAPDPRPAHERRLAGLLDQVEAHASLGFHFDENDEARELAGEDPWAAVIPAILERAAKASHDSARTNLLDLAAGAANANPATAAETTAHLRRVLPACRDLLATCRSEQQRLTALIYLDSIFSEAGFHPGRRAEGFSDYQLGLPEKIMARQARFLARAEGRPVPALPNGANVPEDRIADIVSGLRQVTSIQELRARYSAMTPDEKAAWGIELWRNPEAHSPALDDIRSTITEFRALDAVSSARAREISFAPFVGRRIDAALVRELFKKVIPASPGHTMTLGLEQGPLGLTLWLSDTHAELSGRIDGINPASIRPVATGRLTRLHPDGRRSNEWPTAEFKFGAATEGSFGTPEFWQQLEPRADAPTVFFNLSLIIPPDRDTTEHKSAN